MRFSKCTGLMSALLFTVLTAITAVAQQKVPYSVAQVQKALNDAAYNAGKPDGIWGKRSAKALKKFQQDRGIDTTGRMDTATMSKLFPIQEALRKKIEINSKTGAELQNGNDVAETVVVTPIEKTALHAPMTNVAAGLDQSAQELVTMLRLAEYGIGACKAKSIDAAKVSKELFDLLGPQRFTDIENELRTKLSDIAQGYPARGTDFPSNTCAEWEQMADSRGLVKAAPAVPTSAPTKSNFQTYLVVGGVIAAFLMFRGRRKRA